jgi:hypothetical protein
MNYKIILDENKLKRFIDWLPELKPNQTYYCCLFARSKYFPEFKLKSGETQLRRFTSDKEYLYNKIKQLECELGSYKFEDNPIPQQSLVLTINPNPRDLKKATAEFIIDVTEKLLHNKNIHPNPHSQLLSDIQRSCVSKKPYVHFDFDGVSMEQLVEKIKSDNIVNLDSVNVLVTMNGVHLLIEPDKISEQYTKTWYRKICALPNIDSKAMKGDSLMPVPGCTQGGFTPSLYSCNKSEISFVTPL